MPNEFERRVSISNDVQQLIRDFERLGVPIEEFIGLMGKLHEKTEEVEKRSKGMAAGIKEAAGRIQFEQEAQSRESSENIKKNMDETKKGFAGLKESIQKEMQGIWDVAKPQEVVGIKSGIQALKSSVLGELPFGGILGLMMYGAMREAEVRAAGAQTMRMFQQAGEVGSKAIKGINAEARELGLRLGMGPTGMFQDFAVSAQQFAQVGIDAEDVLKRINIHGGKVGETILQTSVRLDSMFKLGAGTSAKVMSQMIRDFNLDATESARVVAGIGIAARESGTSVTAFTTSVMRSAASMRTMRVDIEEVADAQLKFQKIIETQMPGVSRQFAAGYAEQATQQITQGMAGMSIGMSAVLAERIASRTGRPQTTGLEAYYAFKEGFAGEGQGPGRGIFLEGITELLRMAKETGGTKGEQRYFLEKMVPGLGIEGSRALMGLQEISDKQGITIKEAAASKDGQAALKNAFVNRAKETSEFQKALMQAQDGLARIGAGLLGNVIAIVTLLRGYFAAPGEREKLIDQAFQQSTIATKYLLGGINKLPVAMGHFMRGILAVPGGTPGATTMARRRERAFTPVGAVAGTLGTTAAEMAEEELPEVVTKGVVTAAEAAARARQHVAYRIGKMEGLTLAQRKRLMGIYRQEEMATGAGEITAAAAAEEMGIPGVGAKISKFEREASMLTVRGAGGEIIPIKVIIQTPTGFSGVVEGR